MIPVRHPRLAAMNPPRSVPLALVAAIEATSCAASTRQTTARAVARATPVTQLPGRPPAATTPALAPPPPPPAAPDLGMDTRCIARPRDAFHLRPRPVHASTGTEFPAGTEVQVLGTARMRRGDAELVHGRVLATGAEGFLFVHATELSAQCPVIWQVDDVRGGIDPYPDAPDIVERAVRPGAHRTAAGVLGSDARQLPVHVLARQDFDGDGRVDELLGIGDSMDNDEPDFFLVVRRQGADGRWRGGLVEYVINSEHGRSRYDGVVVSGGAAYIQLSGCAEQDIHGAHLWLACGVDLYRLRPTGAVGLVFSASYSVAEDWRITPGDGESLEVTGRVSGRHQRLRWDAAQFALVPEESWRPDFADPEPQPAVH
jgi:hypothetical protein